MRCLAGRLFGRFRWLGRLSAPSLRPSPLPLFPPCPSPLLPLWVYRSAPPPGVGRRVLWCRGFRSVGYGLARFGFRPCCRPCSLRPTVGSPVLARRLGCGVRPRSARRLARSARSLYGVPAFRVSSVGTGSGLGVHGPSPAAWLAQGWGSVGTFGYAVGGAGVRLSCTARGVLPSSSSPGLAPTVPGLSSPPFPSPLPLPPLLFPPSYGSLPPRRCFSGSRSPSRFVPSLTGGLARLAGSLWLAAVSVPLGHLAT